MITIIDFGAGNLKSVANALTKCHIEFEHAEDADDVLEGQAFLLPGVGSAGAAMQRLRERGMVDAILEVIRRGSPFLGICLGMQLLLDRSEEQDAAGLGVIPGRVKRFSDESLLVPHIGWNQVTRSDVDHPLFDGIAAGSYFYFVHSYYADVAADSGHQLATCDYGGPFAAAVVADNVVGVQFHPEKSGELGLRLLANFCAMAEAATPQG